MSKIIYDNIDDRNHNILFNLNQLNASSGNDKVLPVRCLYCGKIFLISRKDYLDFVHGSNNLMYCSRRCASLAQRKRVTKPCLNCGKMVTKTKKEAEKYPNFFCCKSCAASYNNKRRKRKNTAKLETKRINQLTRARKKLINTLQKYCTKLKKLNKLNKRNRTRTCSVCGQPTCKHPNICNSGFFVQAKQTNIRSKLEKLGFDISTIGTPNVYKEAFKMFRVLRKLYYDLELSTHDIQKLIGAKSPRSVELLFKLAGITRRSLSDSVKCAVKQNKCHPNVIFKNSFFKQGWHTTWNKKRIFYRSSYELDYALQLDEMHIDYDCECLRIDYFDTQRQKHRIAIPDFYLPQINLIVEIKSSFTYDRQEMVDKSNAYKQLGYNFKLILDHKDYDYCPVTTCRYRI